MKKNIFTVLVLCIISLSVFSQEVRIWNFGPTTGTKVLDECSWAIKRDFENNRYYSWVSFIAKLLDKEPTTWFETNHYKKIDYPRPGSRKSRIMWTCIEEATKKLGLKPGDFFTIEISIEQGTGEEPTKFPFGSKGSCMYHFEGQLTKNNEINGRIYEGTYEFVTFDW